MRHEIKILLATSILFTLSAGFLGPIYAIFVQRIGGDILAASGAWAIFTITSGVLTLIFGKLEDHRLNQRKMYVLGYVLATIGTAGYIFVSDPFHLVVVQIILGVAFSIAAPAFDALFTKHTTIGKESLEWGIWEGTWRIATGIAAIIGGVIATFLGFKILFLFMTAFAIVATIVAAQMLKEV